MSINARQRRFVDEYLVDLNATKAAERAGYSSRSAYSTAGELLKMPEIQAAIAVAKQERLERTQVRQDEVLRELIAMYKTNPNDFTFDNFGNATLRDPENKDAWRAVASLKRKTRVVASKDGSEIVEHETELKFWDKNSAVDKAMRHLGILSLEVNLNVNAVEQFLIARHAKRTSTNGANGVHAGA